MAIAHMGDLRVHLTDAHGVLTPAEGRVLRHIARGIIRVTVCVLVAVQVGYGLAPRVDMARPVRGGRLTQVSRPVTQLRREVC